MEGMADLKDRTLELVTKGYRFTDRLLGSAVRPGSARRAPMKLLGSPALVVRGAEGVRLFYDTERMQRTGAMPAIIGGGLFGKGSLHGMDGEEHRNRKAIFVRAAMDPDALRELMADAQREWTAYIDREWVAGEGGTVYDAAVDVYGRSILRWAGIEADEGTLTRLSRWEAQIVDGFAVLGPAYVLQKVRRRQCDSWFEEHVRRARAGEVPVRPGSALDLVLAHRELDGQPLSDHLAAVEIQNVVRPTIAVARFAAFLALAFHEHPDVRERVSDEVVARGTTVDGPYATAVSQEVRRYYPFVPVLPAVARHDLEFEGARVAGGDRVLVDIFGTNRDAEHWSEPDRFDPERFTGDGADLAWSDHFLPQGGGRPETGHRCPGELVTVGLLALTAAELSRLDADLPEQDLSYPMHRMPTAPVSKVRFVDVRRR